MTKRDSELWDSRYRSGDGPAGRRAGNRLDKFAHYVDALLMERRSASGSEGGLRLRSLDVACGAGGAVVWLGERGWHATGVDASAEALCLASRTVAAAGIADRCELIHADLDSWRPAACRYDLVTCFFFLDRDLMSGLKETVRPGGLLIMETFNRHWLRRRPQSNPDFLLADGELAATVTGWDWQVLASCTSGPDADRPTDAIVARCPALT